MDFLFKAPSLSVIGSALAALQASGLVNSDGGPANMLGALCVNDAKGNALFKYGIGRSAISAIGPDGGAVTIPGAGVVGMFYIAIRADIEAKDVPFDPIALGLIAVSASESAEVLGVWA